ncbi:hypothetical protein ACFX11_041469 [Malus domestica]
MTDNVLVVELLLRLNPFQSQPRTLAHSRGLQTFSLPDLPYDYGTLELANNDEIMELHHKKHHSSVGGEPKFNPCFLYFDVNRRQDKTIRRALLESDILRKPPLYCQITWPNTVTHHSNITKWCCNTTSELQTPVAVTDRTDDCSPSVPTHKVIVHDRQRGVSHQFLVPKDQYILHIAESQDITLPFACRYGCCTSCTVCVKSGEIRQPELPHYRDLSVNEITPYWIRGMGLAV